ncbi:MAG: hypothetical protein RLZZ516_2384 [Cyanobacteriota bacterium]|jgi:hypothetical protein
MQLAETVVAVSIFAMPLTVTVQMASLRQLSDQGQMTRQQQMNTVDTDRLALQGTWIQIKPSTCTMRTVVTMKNASIPLTVPAGIQRQLTYLKDGSPHESEGQAILASWTSSSNGELLRQRIYTPMGLGLCS